MKNIDHVVTTSTFVGYDFGLEEIDLLLTEAVRNKLSRRLQSAMKEMEDRIFYPMGSGPVVDIAPTPKGLSPKESGVLVAVVKA